MKSSEAVDAQITELNQWLALVTGDHWVWHAKYLSANDTYAKSNVHQAGPYLAKSLLAAAFCGLSRRAETEPNPDLRLHASIDSHGWQNDIRAVWYNSKKIEGRTNGRDEARLTGWGGRSNPLVDDNATGSLVLFAFRSDGPDQDSDLLRIWIARSTEEEERIVDAVGGVEPGSGITLSPTGTVSAHQSLTSCELTRADIPQAWLMDFPSGEEIVKWVLINRDAWRTDTPDRRLMQRRACEYDVFKSIEREHVLPRISAAFSTVDAFIDFANGVTNRRKARAGRSLELHAKAIFDEERVQYSWTPRTEGNRRPDFIFPSIEKYGDTSWPSDRLYMLAAKTTCKDRWRQILNEAERISTKHLLTVQEGVSVDQHQEMLEENVQLVVPASLFKAYPESIRPSLMTVEQFVDIAGRGS